MLSNPAEMSLKRNFKQKQTVYSGAFFCMAVLFRHNVQPQNVWL